MIVGDCGEVRETEAADVGPGTPGRQSSSGERCRNANEDREIGVYRTRV